MYSELEGIFVTSLAHSYAVEYIKKNKFGVIYITKLYVSSLSVTDIKVYTYYC